MKTRLLAVSLLLAAPLAFAHVVRVVEGVHFKTDDIDFGQPPARRMYGFDDGTGYGGTDGAWRPGTKYRPYGEWVDPVEREKRIAPLRKSLLKAGAEAELAGRYGEANGVYAKLLGMGAVTRAFANARKELFGTSGIQTARGLGAYLRATHPLTPGPLPTNVGSLLKPWVAYAKATTSADYAAVARAYPDSSRAPAALIMAARLGVNAKTRPTLAAMAEARAAAERLLRDHPRSRFAWDAHGILGRVEFLKGNLDRAQAHYETQVKTADANARREMAFYSLIACARASGRRDAVAYAALRWADATDNADPYAARGYLYRTVGRFTGPDAVAFYHRLAGDPRSLAAYLDFRSSLNAAAPDLLALAANARRAAAGTPYQARVDAILARVALSAGDSRARELALGAQKGRGDDRALGTFVLATLDRRAGRLAEARDGFRRLLRESPKSYLSGGARENLAILAERFGDLATAMDLYRALGYEQDVAYLADARMPPAQLAAYVERHPGAKTLRYTLAMRYLRKGEWEAAERALKPFSTVERRRLTSENVERWGPEDGGLQDPLATAQALRRLDEAVQTAEGDEAKAAALSAMGDYYYRHKCLLLYCGPAWKGGRSYSIAFSWNTAVATEQDDAALAVHHDEHECYTQALRRYKKVLADYPNAKVAPHAAYWAAVATNRLANMSAYWRWRDARSDLKSEAVRLMALAAKSPDPALAKRAAKYAPVFATEREETRKAFADERPPERRWNPNRW